MAYDERTIRSRHRGVAQHRLDGRQQRILPDGCLDLIVLGDLLLVAGPDTGARVHSHVEPEPVTGVRLHAGRGPVLLGVPADELRDRTAAPRGPLGLRAGASARGRVVDRPASGLAEWACSSGTGDPFAELVRSLLDSGQGVGEVAAAVGYSPRQLHRRSCRVRLRSTAPRQGVPAGACRGRCRRRSPRGPRSPKRTGFVDQAPPRARASVPWPGVTPTELLRRTCPIRPQARSLSRQASVERMKAQTCSHRDRRRRHGRRPRVLSPLSGWTSAPERRLRTARRRGPGGGLALAFDTRETIQSFNSALDAAAGGHGMALAFALRVTGRGGRRLRRAPPPPGAGARWSPGTRSGACATPSWTTRTATRVDLFAPLGS